MNKKKLICIIASYGAAFLIFVAVLVGAGNSDDASRKTLEATILSISDNAVMVQDSDNVIYTFNNENLDSCDTGKVLLEYTGLLNKNMEYQDVSILGCEVVETIDSRSMPLEWNDEGMFSKYYKLAYNKMKEMPLEERIAQVLLVRYPNDGLEALKKCQFGGYVFFAGDFANKSKEDVKKMINDLQEVANVPILTAVDEEGGKVVRVSSNSRLVDEPFKSPRALYDEGGFSLIRDDTKKKSALLDELGLNLNLAPVVDVVTDKNAYMYERSIQGNTALTSEYARTVIEASQGTGVSYTLKHFPGYGNNSDTHLGSATDSRSYDEIYANDLPPFEAGIKAGAEAILVSHNIVNGVDGDNPASLSPTIHNLLRNELNFTGIIITDDLSMSAVNSITDVSVKAILAGNDLIITTDYKKSINNIINAIQNDTISEDTINKLATRIIAWKYYKGLFYDQEK